MVGYYGRFVGGFFKRGLPITELVRKNNKFEWIEECENSFQELKKRLVPGSVLVVTERNDGFVIYRDAIKKGLECVLL